MNKTLLISLVVAFLGVSGIGGYLLLSNQNKPSSSSNSTAQSVVSNQTGSKKSLNDLMGMSTNQTCTFKDDKQNTGTVYTGGGKFRGDFSGTTNGKVTNTHMISNGTDIYLWFDGSSDGFKMPVGSIEKYTAANETSAAQSVDVNKQVDVECSGWSVDNSKFSLPNIKFQDFGAIMQQAIPNSTSSSDSTNTAQCAACNSLPAEAASQCKQALNCK